MSERRRVGAIWPVLALFLAVLALAAGCSSEPPSGGPPVGAKPSGTAPSGAAPTAAPKARAAPTGRWPAEPIHITLGYAVGGTMDVRIRAIQPLLKEILGVPVVVDNMEGAAGRIAADFVKKQKPDGYNLLMTATPNAMALGVTTGKKFDYVKDFAPIYAFSGKDYNVVAVPPSSRINNMSELAGAMRERKLVCAVSGFGSNSHVVIARLAELVEPREFVVMPYGSSTEAMAQVSNGRGDMAVAATGAGVNTMVLEKKAKTLGIAADAKIALFPEVPTLKEQGYDVVVEGIYGVMGPGGLPESVVGTLDAAFDRAVKDDRFLQAMKKLGGQPAGINPKAFADLVQRQQAMIDRVAPLLLATLQK